MNWMLKRARLLSQKTLANPIQFCMFQFFQFHFQKISIFTGFDTHGLTRERNNRSIDHSSASPSSCSTFILELSSKRSFSPSIFRLRNVGMNEVISCAVSHWIHWSDVQSFTSTNWKKNWTSSWLRPLQKITSITSFAVARLFPFVDGSKRESCPASRQADRYTYW